MDLALESSIRHPVFNFCFQIQLAPLHLGCRGDNGCRFCRMAGEDTMDQELVRPDPRFLSEFASFDVAKRRSR